MSAHLEAASSSREVASRRTPPGSDHLRQSTEATWEPTDCRPAAVWCSETRRRPVRARVEHVSEQAPWQPVGEAGSWTLEPHRRLRHAKRNPGTGGAMLKAIGPQFVRCFPIRRVTLKVKSQRLTLDGGTFFNKWVGRKCRRQYI